MEISLLKATQLKSELKKRGAKTSGRKSELVERLKFYLDNENASCSRSEPLLQMTIPDEKLFKDLGGSIGGPNVDRDMINGYLGSHEQTVTMKAADLYNNYYLNYVKVHGGFIKGNVSASMRKTSYEVNIYIDNDSVKECECECPVGSYPTAHCKHVTVVLLGLEEFSLKKEIKVKETCTDVLQKFHRPKGKFKGSPVKAEDLTKKWKVLEPATSKKSTWKLLMDVKNYCVTSKDDIPFLQLTEPANPMCLEVEHDYLTELEGDQLLRNLNLVQVSRIIMIRLGLGTSKSFQMVIFFNFR